ncbi:ParA family protein [Leptospira sp. 'Mane']|uniref:ParA family protein n=1 Tax=Leptospira sp. 'Mane' TaxID=3387407 RepID=UPI00398A9341
MKIITIASLKGGVGKTTIAAFLGQAIRKRKKILVCDIDPNNNLTDFFLRDVDIKELQSRNIYHSLTGRKELSDCIFKTGFDIDCIPATPELAMVGSELMNDFGSVLRFESDLKSLKYDLILLDTPPSLTYELQASIYVSDLILCPISYNRWTVHGYQLLENQVIKQKKAGKKIKLLGVPSMVTAKKSEALSDVDEIPLTKTHILKSEALENAIILGTALKESSNAWTQFESLAKEVI